MGTEMQIEKQQRWLQNNGLRIRDQGEGHPFPNVIEPCG
jgi:hypothetical protein